MDLTQKPFNLDAEAIAWVEQALAAMTPRQKLAQLINILIQGTNPDELNKAKALGVGSMARMGMGDQQFERQLLAEFNAAAPVPLLVTADLEGSRMTTQDGVVLPNPLGLAAVDDVDATKRAAHIMSEDGKAYGVNWSFTPLLDINKAFRSAIVATRSFGSDPQTIKSHALAQIDALQSNGVAATIKHWPGEGYDDRDQHLVTTINPLSLDEWEETFGALYRAGIEAGVLSVMSAHIAFPAFIRSIDADADPYKPATINKYLNQTLLREKLGFEGIIVSDATAMAGLGAYMKRADFVPEIIASGCDVILFSPDVEQDIAYLEGALEKGTLSQARVDDAVTRQLALKAHIGLHHTPIVSPQPDRDRAADEKFATEVTQRVPTLVKDTQNLFPISPKKHKRVLVFSTGVVFPFTPDPLPMRLPGQLEAEGFEVTAYEKGSKIDPKDFDLVLYLLAEETLLTRGNIFLDWLRLTGDFGEAMRRYWHEIPTAILSFGYPYYLYDAPRVPTYVNAYCTTDEMQKAVLEAMLGRAEWNKNSPVDPFCGLEDAQN